MTDYGVLFNELAIPRLVGTPNHRQVRDVLRRELAARGFAVEDHPFAGRPARALLGTPRLVSGVNLIGRPDGPTARRPNVWLVAHYDSKGQPISMAVRLLGFFALLLGLLTIPLLLVIGIPLTLLGLGVLSLNRVTDSSPGALDNATALVAIFMVLDQLPNESSVGVVFPDAEEYGLVGARALAAERAGLFAGTTVLNLDGLDDGGRPFALLHRPGELSAALVEALHARRARWLPVIVDGLALARVADECVTILKGNLATMRIVHRPGDRPARVRLDGAASVAAGLARVLRER